LIEDVESVEVALPICTRLYTREALRTKALMNGATKLLQRHYSPASAPVRYKDAKLTQKREPVTPSWVGRVPQLKPGQYADGMPIHSPGYFCCKPILRPNKLHSRESFFDFGRVFKEPAKEHGVKFTTDGFVSQPVKLREVLFIDTDDFRLYNNVFQAMRRKMPRKPMDGTARARLHGAGLHLSGADQDDVAPGSNNSRGDSRRYCWPLRKGWDRTRLTQGRGSDLRLRRGYPSKCAYVESVARPSSGSVAAGVCRDFSMGV
jgi:hypothetical protein